MAKQKKDEYQPTEEDIVRMTRLANCLLDMVIEDQRLPRRTEFSYSGCREK